MDEHKIEQEEQTAQEQPREGVKYATPMMHLWAWVGVVYMVLLVLLNTYGLAHGYFLSGIGGLLIAPALCGLGASAILRYREGKGRGGLAVCVLVSGASFLLAVLNLLQAIPALLSQL